MRKDDMEREINLITEKRWEEMGGHCLLTDKTILKLAVLDAYKAGMEAAREVYTS